MIKIVETYIYITLGGVIQGLAMGLFLFPNYIPSGGAGGLAVLINYWIQVPLSISLWIVNFSMLVIAVYWLGNFTAVGTMFGITITSLTIHFVSMFPTYSSFGVIFDLVIGSIILGIGIGILLKNDVSNGGMGVLALLISKMTHSSPGKPLFLINGSIFLFTASVIDWNIVIFAIVSQWIATRVVDTIYKLNINVSSLPLLVRTKK